MAAPVSILSRQKTRSGTDTFSDQSSIGYRVVPHVWEPGGRPPPRCGGLNSAHGHPIWWVLGFWCGSLSLSSVRFLSVWVSRCHCHLSSIRVSHVPRNTRPGSSPSSPPLPQDHWTTGPSFENIQWDISRTICLFLSLSRGAELMGRQKKTRETSEPSNLPCLGFSGSTETCPLTPLVLRSKVRKVLCVCVRERENEGGRPCFYPMPSQSNPVAPDEFPTDTEVRTPQFSQKV